MNPEPRGGARSGAGDDDKCQGARLEEGFLFEAFRLSPKTRVRNPVDLRLHPLGLAARYVNTSGASEVAQWDPITALLYVTSL